VAETKRVMNDDDVKTAVDALKRAYTETLIRFKTKSDGPRLEPVDSLMERDDGQES
jgi:hypothetical protein